MSKKDNSSKNNFHEKILRQNMHLGVINNLTQGFLVKRFFGELSFFDTKCWAKTEPDSKNMD